MFATWARLIIEWRRDHEPAVPLHPCDAPRERQVVKGLAGQHVAESRDLVGPVERPAELVEAAQHPVRALAAKTADAHLLGLRDRQWLPFDDDLGAGRSHRDKVTGAYSMPPAENDLHGCAIAAEQDTRKPDSLAVWVSDNVRDPSGYGAGYNQYSR